MKTINTLLRGMSALAFVLGSFQAQAQDITLHAYVDANNNCVRDPGEQPVSSQLFVLYYNSGQYGTVSSTDCNGTAVLKVTNPDLNTVQNQLVITPFSPAGSSSNEMSAYISP